MVSNKFNNYKRKYDSLTGVIHIIKPDTPGIYMIMTSKQYGYNPTYDISEWNGTKFLKSFKLGIIDEDVKTWRKLTEDEILTHKLNYLIK